MNRLQIPYGTVLLEPRDLDHDELDSLLKRHLEASARKPVIVEVTNGNIQYLLFVSEGQPYWAGVNDGECFRTLRIRDFFMGLRRTQFPKIIAYQADLLLCHSLLVYLQKKPDLKVSSTLVDLDDLLDRAEKEKMSAIITAREPSNFILLRYQNGKPVSCHHNHSSTRTGEAAIREDFLVKVYTISTHRPLEIDLFTDLAVTHAEDARPIPPDHSGSIPAFYLSQPPRLVVKLKSRPLKTYPVTGNEISIGRLAQNDIVIDNLSVSRKHAVISASADGYVLTDLDSKNGTLLNGSPIQTSRLSNGDTITIGKYQIIFQMPGIDETASEDLDQTVIIPHFRQGAPAEAAPPKERAEKEPPRLFRKSVQEEYVLERERTVIGADRGADIRMGGLFGPRVAAEVVRRGEDFVIQAKDPRRKVKINGEELDEKVLQEEDLIAIGSEEFVFKA